VRFKSTSLTLKTHLRPPERRPFLPCCTHNPDTMNTPREAAGKQHSLYERNPDGCPCLRTGRRSEGSRHQSRRADPPEVVALTHPLFLRPYWWARAFSSACAFAIRRLSSSGSRRCWSSWGLTEETRSQGMNNSTWLPVPRQLLGEEFILWELLRLAYIFFTNSLTSYRLPSRSITDGLRWVDLASAEQACCPRATPVLFLR
jgi:hypothetical protein